MKNKIRKTNASLAFFNNRLDEIRMNGQERLKAKARLAQSEAFANAVVTLIGLFKRAFKSAEPRRYRSPTATHG